MTSSVGEWAIVWTARLAVAGYLARIACDVAGRTDAAGQRLARWCWTVGWFALVLHVLAAFHFAHHGSHAAAWEHVRQQTRLQTGWDSGSGLLINYGLTLWWTVDCALWWRRLEWPRRRWAYGITQAVFAFLMFNATVVFGPRGWVVVAVTFAILIAAIGLRRWRSGL